MTENKKVIGICSIGSGVGQSVITSCNATSLPIKTIGLGNNPLAYGQYECDDYSYIPSYYQKEYLNELIETCKDKKIDLLIPGHDDEAQILAANATEFKKINVDVLTSSIELINICRSKDKLGNFFSEAKDLFVRSYTYDEIVNANKFGSELSFPLIAKPKNGYASRDVYIVQSINDIERLGNKLIYQEIAIPEKNDPAHDIYIENLKIDINTQVGELSIQLLADREGKIHGRFATYNKLNNGIPIEVIPYESSKLDKAIDRLIPLIQEKGLRGPINLQGRMTDNGLKIFEINPRFTGITGLRAKFGFNEVAACIKNWLFNEEMQGVHYNKSLVGIRQTADKTIKLKENNVKLIKYKPDIYRKQYVLITGSTGVLGRYLVELLSREKEYIIYTLDRIPENSIKLHGKLIEKALGWNDIENDNFNLGLIDTLCHLASARPFHTTAQIVDGLTKTNFLFTKASICGVREIIFSSSQSVYGSQNSTPWTESMMPQPETFYAASKLSSELMLNNLSKINPNLKSLSLRFSALTGGCHEAIENEALARVIKNFYDEVEVKVFNGRQKLGRMHYYDAASAIINIIRKGIISNESLNVAPKNNETLLETIDLIESAFSKHGIKRILNKNIIHDEHASSFILDGALYEKKYSWQKAYTTKMIICDIIRFLEKK